MNTFKIGDKFKVTSEFIKEDRPYIGKIFTISSIRKRDDGKSLHYLVKEIDNGSYFFLDFQMEKINNTLRGLME